MVDQLVSVKSALNNYLLHGGTFSIYSGQFVHFSPRGGVAALLIALLAFEIISRIRIGSIAWINSLSKTVFITYIITTPYVVWNLFFDKFQLVEYYYRNPVTGICIYIGVTIASLMAGYIVYQLFDFIYKIMSKHQFLYKKVYNSDTKL